MECVYPPPKDRMSQPKQTPPNVVLSATPPTVATPISTPIPVTNEFSTPILGEENVQLLRLMHHFCTCTAKTTTVEPAGQELIQTHMVNIAFDYPFLLHAILALAALHLGRINVPARATYLLQAERHYETATTLFRNDIKGINDTNSQAVLYFAAILDPYSSSIPTFTNDLDHAFDSILHSFALTRRLRPMVSQFYPEIFTSEFARFIPADTQGIDWAVVVPPAETELTKLRKFSELVQQLYPPDIIEAYKHAIHALEMVFGQVAKLLPQLPSPTLVKMWVHLISPRFLELLSERQPGALIIFTHYGVLIKRIHHFWFLEGYAEQVLNIAEAFLPGEWKAWIDWPREQISAGGEAS